MLTFANTKLCESFFFKDCLGIESNMFRLFWTLRLTLKELHKQSYDRNSLTIIRVT